MLTEGKIRSNMKKKSNPAPPMHRPKAPQMLFACEHNYEFQGLVFDSDNRAMPGTGACKVYYEDRYYCTKCLEILDRNRRCDGNTYEPIKYNAVPK